MKERKLSTVAGCVPQPTFECSVDNYGRITLPKAIRERMPWGRSDKVHDSSNGRNDCEFWSSG
jgi:hypothetical protein